MAIGFFELEDELAVALAAAAAPVEVAPVEVAPAAADFFRLALFLDDFLARRACSLVAMSFLVRTSRSSSVGASPTISSSVNGPYSS